MQYAMYFPFYDNRISGVILAMCHVQRDISLYVLNGLIMSSHLSVIVQKGFVSGSAYNSE